MNWPRPKANGVLGLWYPWLIQSESLHCGYNSIVFIPMVIGMYYHMFSAGE